MSTLKADLKEGYLVELELKEILEEKGFTVTHVTEDKQSDYDLLVTSKKGKSYTMEVKYDRMMDSTGNVAVELHKVLNGQKELSGLSITKSDYYVYKLNKKFYSIPTTELKALVDKLIEKDGLFLCMGGDNKSVQLGLISKYIFKKYSKQIN